MLDFLLHIDDRLAVLIGQYGTSTYGLLAAVIFAETGLVVTPFLPGDSLLFAAGMLAASTALDPWPLVVTLAAAAITGDNSNYWIGRTVGARLLTANRPIVNRAHLDRAHRFYARYGPLTVVLARFIPIVRTFAPFTAGLARMDYRTFLPYSVAGGLLWIGLFVWVGYLFGNLPIIRDNFELVVLAIIAVSILPPLSHFFAARSHR